MRASLIAGAGSAALILAACTADPTSVPDEASGPAAPRFNLVSSECGGRTELTDSRVTLDWGTNTSNAVTNDASVAYTGGVGGVHAKLFYHDGNCSRSGDLVFDPDANAGRTGARKLRIRIRDRIYPAGPFINFAAAMQLGAPATTAPFDAKIYAKLGNVARATTGWPATVSVPGYLLRQDPNAKMRFTSTGIARCESIEIESVTMTRHTGSFEGLDPTFGQWSTATLGRWTMSSTGTATCITTSKQGPLATNFPFAFSVDVNEVRGVN